VRTRVALRRPRKKEGNSGGKRPSRLDVSRGMNAAPLARFREYVDDGGARPPSRRRVRQVRRCRRASSRRAETPAFCVAPRRRGKMAVYCGSRRKTATQALTTRARRTECHVPEPRPRIRVATRLGNRVISARGAGKRKMSIRYPKSWEDGGFAFYRVEDVPLPLEKGRSRPAIVARVEG